MTCKMTSKIFLRDARLSVKCLVILRLQPLDKAIQRLYIDFLNPGPPINLLVRPGHRSFVEHFVNLWQVR